MIDKEKYLKAKQEVSEYEEKMNLTLCKDRTCCVCQEKVIKSIRGEYLDPLRQESGMWDDGVVEKITFGFGSRQHDMESFYIAMCDDCMTDLLKKGLATNVKEIRTSIREFTTAEDEH